MTGRRHRASPLKEFIKQRIMESKFFYENGAYKHSNLIYRNLSYIVRELKTFHLGIIST